MKKYICIFALTVMSCGSVQMVNGVKVKSPNKSPDIKKELTIAIPSFFLGYYLVGSYWKRK